MNAVTDRAPVGSEHRVSPAPSLDSVPTRLFSILKKSFPTKYLASALRLATALALV